MNQNTTPPLTLSITTGLLTLSVHDNLTFDGVEVALHPDLFNVALGKGVGVGVGVGVGSSVHSRQSSRDSSAFIHHSRDASYASSILNSAQNTPLVNNTTNMAAGMATTPATPILVQEDGNSFARRDSPLGSGFVNNNTAGTNRTNRQSSNVLKAGDLIEIKVWEQKNNIGQKDMGGGKGSGGNRLASYSKNLVDRAATKLQQHVLNQSLSSSSFQNVYHPLADPKKSSSSKSASREIPSSSQHSLASSCRPPIVPRGTSNSSSLVTSPKHTGPTPSLSPSPKHQHQHTPPPKLQLLPRWTNNNESKDSIFDDTTPLESNISTSTTVIGSSAVDNNKSSTVVKSSTDAQSMLQNDSGSFTPIISTFDTSQSFDNYNVANGNSNGNPIGNLQEKQSELLLQRPGVIELISSTHNLKTKFVMNVTEKSLNALKSTGRTQISLLKQVAALYNLSAYDIVTVTKIDKSEEAMVLEKFQADHITLTIKDQFISRGEMYQFQNYFVGKWIYAGERLKTNYDMFGHVMDIRNGDHELKSGFLTDQTRITFRSRSARIFWLVQISSEMWDYASPYVERENRDGCCEIYFDKFVSFMKRLFEEWKALDVTHSLTILFFSRSYINSKFSASSETRAMLTSSPEKSSIYRDTDGRLYEDFYKVIADNVTQKTNWDSIVTDVKKAFVSYPSEVGWTVSRDNTYSRVPSTAAQGNILEAINTALNVMKLHYIDRDLKRSGNSVVIISAGSGLFEVDKNLAGITKQRMMDNGIGSDMLSLGLPPLHVAPFFLYKETSTPDPDEHHDFDGWKTFFEIPHWMHLSFVAYDQDQRHDLEEAIVEQQSQPPIRIMANGFIVRDKATSMDTDNGENNNEHKKSSKTQRNLISGRDFEDILEACRPRKLGETIGGMPRALVAQMKIFGLIGKVEENDNVISSEWGSVDFDIDPHDSASDDRSRSSHSTVTSHFTNAYSFILSRSPGSNVSPTMLSTSIQIQQSRSHEMPSFLLNETKLRTLTSEFDKNVFIPGTPILNQSSRPSESEGGGIPSPLKTPNMSGIGEAIHQYENNSDPNQSVKSFLATPQLIKVTPREPTAITRVKKALSTPSTINSQPLVYQRPTSYGYLDRPQQISSLDVTQHTVTFPQSTPLEIPNPRMISRSMQSDVSNMTRQSRKETLQASNNDSLTAISSSPRGRKSYKAVSPTGRKRLNVQAAKIVNVNQSKKTHHNQKLKNRSSPTPLHQYSRRKQWVLNPFRQEDEDEVLAKRNHNSRRWSHVFPQGETEFKRHTGPNFKSLCQPAILPVKIDVYPTQEEFNERYNFRFHDVHLAAMEVTYYEAHADLLMEMVRQRLVQDFQLVSQAVLMESRNKAKRESDVKQRNGHPLKKSPSDISIDKKDYPRKSGDNIITSGGSPAIALSMGHRFQTIQHKPDLDAVRVVIYSRNDASNEKGGNKFKYNFKLWLPTSKTYTTVNQSFDKYPDEYNWNGLDNLICGDPDKTLTESTRYRRLSFRIIPESYQDSYGEQEYIKKIKKIIDFLASKHPQKMLHIRIISSEERAMQEEERKSNHAKYKVASSEERVIMDAMERKRERAKYKVTRFIVHLKKRDKYEWMEVVVNSVFDTARAFRISFNWLVATSMTIETQVSLLQRRCTNYGLNLVSAAHISSDSNMYLHPFLRPECIRMHSNVAKVVEEALLKRFDFCDDGKISVKPEDIRLHFGVEYKINNSKKGGWRADTSFFAQQYINRIGTLFIRLLPDKNDTVVFVVLENRRHIGSNNELLLSARRLLRQLKDLVKSIDNDESIIS